MEGGGRGASTSLIPAVWLSTAFAMILSQYVSQPRSKTIAIYEQSAVVCILRVEYKPEVYGRLLRTRRKG